jgi:hypothetical protein
MIELKIRPIPPRMASSAVIKVRSVGPSIREQRPCTIPLKSALPDPCVQYKTALFYSNGAIDGTFYVV